jgi:hypothetical protein
LGDLNKPTWTLRLGTGRLGIPTVQHDRVGAGTIAIARGLRLAAHSRSVTP